MPKLASDASGGRRNIALASGRVALWVGCGDSYVAGARFRRHGARHPTRAAVGARVPHCLERAKQPCESRASARAAADLGASASAGLGGNGHMEQRVSSEADEFGRVRLDVGEARADSFRNRRLARSGSYRLVIRSADSDEQAILRKRPTSPRRPRHQDLSPLSAAVSVV